MAGPKTALQHGNVSNDPFLTHIPPRAPTAPLAAPARHKALLPQRSLSKTVTAAVFGAPMGVFMATALTLAVFWQVSAAGALVALGGLATIFVAGQRSPKGDPFMVLAVCSALIVGSLTGVYAHEAYVGPFFAIALGREYTDVLANSPAAAYADAGRLLFAKTSTVDTTRAVGYMDHQTFCAAPILDSGPAQARVVGFWAVGVDCCGARGDFECGRVGNGTAKSGVLIGPDGWLTTARVDFLRAIKQAAAVNDLIVEEKPILVRWVEDPNAELSTALISACVVLLFGLCIYVPLLLCTTVFSMSFGEDRSKALPK